MSFALFILLNFLVLVRPEDLYPPIAGFRLYLAVIAVCTVSALPELQRLLDRDSLRRKPVAVCVLGLLPAMFLAFVVRNQLGVGLEFIGEFAKVVLFFLLLVAVVNTPERLRAYCGWLVLMITAVGTVAVLDFEQIVDFPGMDPVSQWTYDESLGENVKIERIIGVGLFADPNDLCAILVVGMVLAGGMLASSPGGLGRLFWAVPLCLLAYVAFVTKSRGGLLAFGSGVGGYLLARYGFKRCLPLVVLGAAGIAATLAGGGDSRGTSHARLMLWANGLSDLFKMPFYIPTGLAPGYYIEEMGQVAHNTFVNAYVELGLLGGGLLLAAFYNGLRLGYDAVRDPDADEWSRRLGPFVFAALCAWAGGCYSLTRDTHIPTYLMLGLATAYAALSKPDPDPRLVVTDAWWRRTAVLAAGGLLFLKFLTQGLGLLGV